MLALRIVLVALLAHSTASGGLTASKVKQKSPLALLLIGNFTTVASHSPAHGRIETNHVAEPLALIVRRSCMA
jgi:hypothetical protein